MEKSNSFPSLRDLPLEVRLTAWLDGQMSDEESAEIEHLIATSEEASAILDKLAAGAEFGNKAFDDMLSDPVPLHLVRAIKEAGKAHENHGKPGIRPANKNGFFSFMPQLVAASAVLLLAGGYSGYFIGINNADRNSAAISETSVFAPSEQVLLESPNADGVKTRGFQMAENPAPKATAFPLDQAMAGFHRVYSAQSARLSEMPLSDTNAIKTWLTDATDVDFAIPDLSADGFSFAGARLLAAGDRPMGTLFYRNELGETLMVGFWSESTKQEKASIRTIALARANVSLFHKGNIGVAFVAPVERQDAELLAEKIVSAF